MDIRGGEGLRGEGMAKVEGYFVHRIRGDGWTPLQIEMIAVVVQPNGASVKTEFITAISVFLEYSNCVAEQNE